MTGKVRKTLKGITVISLVEQAKSLTVIIIIYYIIIIWNHVLDPNGSVMVSFQRFLGLPRLLRPLAAYDKIWLGSLSGSTHSTCYFSLSSVIYFYYFTLVLTL
jgi:hypothetical protein